MAPRCGISNLGTQAAGLFISLIARVCCSFSYKKKKKEKGRRVAENLEIGNNLYAGRNGDEKTLNL